MRFGKALQTLSEPFLSHITCLRLVHTGCWAAGFQIHRVRAWSIAELDVALKQARVLHQKPVPCAVQRIGHATLREASRHEVFQDKARRSASKVEGVACPTIVCSTFEEEK